MRRFLPVVAAFVAVALVAGVAFAQMGRGPIAGGMGSGPMMGPMMGDGGCPGMMGTAATTTPITEEKARELAQAYADKYLKGYAVERVLPFTGMHGAMYTVELAGPGGEVRTFHVNPWGNVMPFGGPWRRTG